MPTIEVTPVPTTTVESVEPVETPKPSPTPTPTPTPTPEPTFENLGEFKLTAYCSCQKCCGYWATVRPLDEDGVPIVYTASGAIAEAGTTIAVDTSVIPHGSVVEINGHQYIAQDTGSSIVGNRIDVYFDDHQQAVEFGVQYANVLLVKEGE